MSEAKKRVKRITAGDGGSLRDLDISPGDMIGFDYIDFEMPRPFIITRVGGDLERLREHPGSRPGAKKDELYLVGYTSGGLEYWKLKTMGGTIGLFSPRDFAGIRIPNLSDQRISLYSAESAYVGKEEILGALMGNGHSRLDFYVPWLKTEFERLELK